jgi:hypothetical protein
MNVEPRVLEVTSGLLSIRVVEAEPGWLTLEVEADEHADIAIDRTAMERVTVRIRAIALVPGLDTEANNGIAPLAGIDQYQAEGR